MLKLKVLVAASLMLGVPATVQAQTASGPSLSEASRKIVQQHLAERNTDIQRLLAERQRLETQRDALLTPATYDEQKLGAILAQLRTIGAQISEEIDLSTLALLKSLPENDRNLFLASLTRTPPSPVTPPSGGQGR